MLAINKKAEEACGCGHGHQHERAGREEYGNEPQDCCGYDRGHTHARHRHEEERVSSQAAPDGAGQQIYILENLACANCASKMEQKIREMPGVRAANITYATKQLCVAADNTEALLPEIRRICASIESGVTVIPREEAEQIRPGKKRHILAEHRVDIAAIIVGAVMFAAGEIIGGSNPLISDVLFIASYVLLGWEIVWTALKNLTKGHVFDENFLMSIATLAAFGIGDFAEAVGVMLFYRVGELFEDIAVARSRSQIMDAVDMRPEVVNIVRGDNVSVIPAGEALAGDILLIRAGDRIPLDGTVVEGESRIDTSPVTGEPVPVSAAAGAKVISGCVNGQGVLKMRAEKPLSESMVTRILDSVENAAASKPKIDKFITKFARVYTPVVVLAALATAILPSLVTGDFKHWIYTAITFLVISCPCALVLSVPLAFFSGIGAGSRRGILFKGGAAIEALKDIKAVIMDKTGTVTRGNFQVQRIVSQGKLSKKQILNIAADCEQDSTHPIGVSAVEAAKEQGLALVRPQETEEIPGKGIRASFPEGIVLCGNRALMDLYEIDIRGYRPETYGTEALVAVDGKLEGYLVIADVIKEDAKESVRRMKSGGLKTVMLTGDARENALAVAKETGIEEVRAQLLPQDKLDQLREIRKKYGAVLFVGDGINDAPVLAGADVGAAMGSGADAAIEAADVVYMTSQVKAIPESIDIAKATGKIAVQNVVVALAVKLLVIILGFAGFANMWMAVFADTGVAMLCVLNSVRVLYKRF